MHTICRVLHFGRDLISEEALRSFPPSLILCVQWIRSTSPTPLYNEVLQGLWKITNTCYLLYKLRVGGCVQILIATLIKQTVCNQHSHVCHSYKEGLHRNHHPWHCGRCVRHCGGYEEAGYDPPRPPARLISNREESWPQLCGSGEPQSGGWW